MKRILLFHFLISLSSLVFAQKFTIYGTVKSTEGEALTGANVSIKELKTGTVSNGYGFYSLTAAPGKYTVSYSFLGCKTTEKTIDLNADTEINIEFENQTSEIQQVEIKAGKKDRNISKTTISSQNLDIEIIKKMPSLVGEADVMKSLQMLPGIQTANEGTVNLSIRGGSYSQNLILLDEAPVYNASHALSFFSVFNPDALKSVTVYKGNFPVQYGGKVSSVVDIRMKEGNDKKFSVSGGIGPVASRLTVEGPIRKEKSSFIISGRYSYAGFTVNKIGELAQTLNVRGMNDFVGKNEINFYDLNAKVNFTLNNKNHLYFSTYTGSDHFYYYDINFDNSMDWGNTTGTLRWNHIFSSKLFSNLSAIYSRYGYSYTLRDDARRFNWTAGMQLFSLKYDFDYYPAPKHVVKFGFETSLNTYQPGRIEPRDTLSVSKTVKLDDKRSVNISAYASDDYKITDFLTASCGIRASAFGNIGPGKVYYYTPDMQTTTDSAVYGKGKLIRFYGGLEPSVGLRFSLNENNSLKAGYAHKYQFQQLITNSSVGLPTDVWIPADKYIKPQQSDNYSFGYFGSFAGNALEFSTEVYYRKIRNIIDYRDNADLFLNPKIETQVLHGQAEAYGLEVMLAKNTGRFTGFVSYTLAKVQQQINGVNENRPYSPRYDKRHNLSLSATIELNKKWSFSSVFKYVSGGYTTIPDGMYSYLGANYLYYSDRNGYLLPAYESWDVSMTWHKVHKNKRTGEWVFSVVDILDRKNMFALYVNSMSYKTSASLMYLHGILPSISYNFKF